MTRCFKRNSLCGFLAALLSACPAQRPETPTSEAAPPSAPTPAVEAKVETAPPKEAAVAALERLFSRVTFRRRQEGVWQEGSANLPLFHLDAVQTHTAATARIVFLGGSKMEVGEKTLVVINGARNATKSLPDRAVVRAGKLEGHTDTELWILTSAALLRLKAKRSGETAKAVLAVNEGKKMEVTLVEGAASMTHTKPKTSQPTTVDLIPKKTVTIAAPVPSDVFGFEDTEEVWEARAPDRNVSAVAPSTNSATPGKAPSPAPSKLNLVISEPPDYAEVTTDKIVLKGRTTGKGGKIFVNGKEVKIEADLGFSTTVALKDGANSVLIQLIRPEGESVFRRWTVIRND